MENVVINKKVNEKRLAIILLVAIAVIGSICTFFMTNLLMSDLSNMFYGTHDAYIIASFPGFVWAMYSILAEIYVYRYFYRPQYRKSLTLTYLLIAACFAVFGIVMCVLTGAIIYKDFFAPWVFPGYTIITLISHIVVLVGSIYLYIRFRKTLPNDETKRPIKLQYVLYTVILVILVFFAFDRFGAFLLSPLYIEWRTFDLTFPFYVSLLLPMAEFVHMVLYMFDDFKNSKNAGLIYSIIMIVADIVFIGAYIILGQKYTIVISGISPALALERLAAMPYDTILTIVIMILLTGYNFGYSIFRYRKNKAKEKKAE